MYKVTAEQYFALFFGFKEKPLKYEIKKHGRPSNHYIFLITFFLWLYGKMDDCTKHSKEGR